MPRLNIPHQRQLVIPAEAIAPNTTTYIDLPNSGLLREMWFTLFASFGGGAATGLKHGGILRLIKSISIDINGSDRISPLTGEDLASLYLIDWGREVSTTGDPLADASAQSSFPLMWILSRTDRALATSLDLRRREDRDVRARLKIEWGDVSDIFTTPATRTVTTASRLFLQAVYQINHPVAAIQPVRDMEYTDHKVTQAESGRSFKVRRRDGAKISRVFIVETVDGILTTLSSTYITVLVDSVERFNSLVTVNTERESAMRNLDLPHAIKVIDLLSYGEVLSGENSDNLDEDLRIELDVSAPAGTDRNIRIIVEYIRPMREQ